MSPKVMAVREYAAAHPEASYAEIARAVGCGAATVTRAMKGVEGDEARQRRLLRGSGLIDETGKRYGRLTVLRHDKGLGWLCRCDCGREIRVEGGQLRKGDVVRCGMCSDVREGDRFGALVTLRRVGEGNGGGRLSMRWLCRCDCGREVVRYESHLLGNDKTSCGCRAEMMRKQAETSGRTDGTKLSSLTAKTSKANKTGVKGVFRSSKTGEYVACIKLRGVNYRLGSYRTLARAAQARREAEERMFDPILEDAGRPTTGEAEDDE